MLVYIVSKSERPVGALDEGSLISISHGGSDPLADAKDTARYYALTEGQRVYVYQVDIQSVGALVPRTEVDFVPALQIAASH